MKDCFNKHSFVCDTIYLGGGTPSTLCGEDLQRIITTVKECFNVTKDVEITVECNPNSDIEALIPFFSACGVNRVSLGMQSAVDIERKKLGRTATKQRIFDIINVLKTHNITNISLDIMLGIPEQTLESLKETLDFIRVCDVKHVSAYILNIEENTPFFKLKEKLNFPSEDDVCEFYEFTSKYLKEIGFEHYEISNFAIPGFESKHNNKYWLLEDYLGLGAAAHSLLNGKRYYFESDVDAFINGSKPIYDGDGGDVNEYIMLSLRLKSGLKICDLQKKYGLQNIDFIKEKATILRNNGLVSFDGERIALTEKGFLISNSIINEFIK